MVTISDVGTRRHCGTLYDFSRTSPLSRTPSGDSATMQLCKAAISISFGTPPVGFMRAKQESLCQGSDADPALTHLDNCGEGVEYTTT
jgi:hypothetical protein